MGAYMEIEDFGIGGSDDLDLGPMWLRRMSWDSLPCDIVTDVQKSLGLVPAGDPEQEDQDHRQSHARINLVEQLSPSVEYLAPLVSKVLTRAILMNLTETSGQNIDSTGEIEEKICVQNAEIIRSAVLTIIAQFIDTGVLGYPQGWLV
jgi:hypothetical protein